MRFHFCKLQYTSILAAGFLLFACESPKYKGFAKTKNGLYYCLKNIGEGERYAKPGDYITAQIRIRTERDSFLFDTRKIGLEGAVTFIMPEKFEYEKDYREGYLFLTEGDSATFITDAYTVFIKKNDKKIPKGLTSESVVYIETKVLKIQNQKEHMATTLEEEKKMEVGEFEENKLLKKYIEECNIEASPIANGMYYMKLSDGSGASVHAGNIALLNYKGFFLNGRCFDSSFELQPFEYIVGVEDQLIPGLVAGIREMKEGEKAKFIIPSHLAFGSSGSASGMIPPFTTVIYEVDLLKVQ